LRKCCHTDWSKVARPDWKVIQMGDRGVEAAAFVNKGRCVRLKQASLLLWAGQPVLYIGLSILENVP
jgi:hypothetical protein